MKLSYAVAIICTTALLTVAYVRSLEAQTTVKWNQAVLTWTAPTDCFDIALPVESCVPTGYKIQQQQADSTWSTVALVTGLVWTSPDLAPSRRYCWRVVPTNSQVTTGTQDGRPSPTGCKDIPAGPPATAPGPPRNFLVR